jgi:hypothetical protein
MNKTTSKVKSAGYICIRNHLLDRLNMCKEGASPTLSRDIKTWLLDIITQTPGVSSVWFFGSRANGTEKIGSV